MRRIIFILGLLLCSALMLNVNCNESMPPYEQPNTVYSITLNADQPDLEFVRRDIDWVLMGKNTFGFTMNIINIFDETLAGAAQDTIGELQIYWKQNPTVTRTFQLEPDNEINTDELSDPSFVFFDPGDSIRLSVVWTFWRDDQNTYMWDHVNSHAGNGTITYDPMTFVAQARFQLFNEATSAYSNEVEFTVTFYREE